MKIEVGSEVKSRLVRDITVAHEPYMICQVMETEKRKVNKKLDWRLAEKALDDAGVPNKTEALLILKAKGMIDVKPPKRE